MKKQVKKNAFSIALSYLEELIRQQKHIRKTRLPTTASMASEAGVAYETMRKAVNELVSKEILVARPGRGIHIERYRGQPIKSLYTLSEAPADNRLRWQKAASSLKQDILQGHFGWNRLLPSQKELLIRYGVSYPTLRKVLSLCIDEGLIKPEGRWYATSLKKPSVAYSRIILLGDERDETGVATGVCGDDFMRSLEHTCATSGVRLETYAYRWNEGVLQFKNVATGRECIIQDDNDILGFVYAGIFAREIESRLLDRNGSAGDVQEIFMTVLRMLLPFGRPIAVYTFEQDLKIPFSTGPNSPIRIFRMAAPATSAVKVARYLLTQRHKKIAYISPFHQSLWSQMRYDSLVETYTDAGYNNNVRLIAINDHYSLLSYYKDSERHYNIDSVLSGYKVWKKEKFPNLTGYYDHAFSTFCLRYMTLAEVIYRLTPVLRTLSEDPDTTAWVTANDGVAEMVIDFMRARNKKTPDFISLASFDNTVISVHHGITSFDFNIPAAVNSMIAFLLNPQVFYREKKNEVVDIEGVIIERNSVIKCRK
ncbi:MAG: GntR family transcriptional regulator [Chitinivibrionales bacterium]|nr:GntR family transcriptional regulator [Chitinivibrionales bacterium]